MPLQPADKLLVVISYFNARPADHLYHLLDSLHSTPADIEYDICLVINEAHKQPPDIHSGNIKYLHRRENTGMNIGAWDYGWRNHRDYGYYLFLQDECMITGSGWGRKFADRLASAETGLVGESINNRWNKSWDKLKTKRQASPDQHRHNKSEMGDAAFYMDFMGRHGIDPGPTGRHVRALVWALRGNTLDALDGFPIGTTYGECIAAEIAVSRKIEAMGLKVVQLDSEPFSFVQHAEWSGDRKTTAGETINRVWWKRLIPWLGARN